MAGIGSSGIPGLICGELEPEWARQCPAPALVHNATAMPFPGGSIGAIVTSPTYGNRMADHHEARDTSHRNTYRHQLGRPLAPANTGQFQWGPAYRALHLSIYAECHRVLMSGGQLVVNVKDHIRKGQVQHVTSWHMGAMLDTGFRRDWGQEVECPGNRNGAGAHLRVDHEYVMVFTRLAATTPTVWPPSGRPR